MKKFSYWQRRWYRSWWDAQNMAAPTPDPDFAIPGLDGLRSFPVKEGEGGWIYFRNEEPGTPPGTLLPDCEYVSEENALAALEGEIARRRAK